MPLAAAVAVLMGIAAGAELWRLGAVHRAERVAWRLGLLRPGVGLGAPKSDRSLAASPMGARVPAVRDGSELVYPDAGTTVSILDRLRWHAIDLPPPSVRVVAWA